MLITADQLISRREALIEFIKLKHITHLRKFTGDPYFTHLLAVAEMSAQKAYLGFEKGLCHDVVEDKWCTFKELQEFLLPLYGKADTFEIIACTFDLTEVFTKEGYPTWNRAKRKLCECGRLHCIKPDSQTVKYADLINNTDDIVENDPEFAKTYLKEKLDILDGMDKGDEELYLLALETLKRGLIKIKSIEDEKLRVKKYPKMGQRYWGMDIEDPTWRPLIDQVDNLINSRNGSNVA